jgi:hypothetical protein
MPDEPRRNLEKEALATFVHVVEGLSLAVCGRGNALTNRFDPGFGLQGTQGFQYGDLRVETHDRLVVVEVESGGGLTNLVKYWPLSERTAKPILLLHAFGQGSLNDYISHLRLWDFTWDRMRTDIWRRPSPGLFARRFQYSKTDYRGLTQASDELQRCLTLPLADALETVFGYGPNWRGGAPDNALAAS